MLARPEVHSWRQYSFAGSITLVFASGAGLCPGQPQFPEEMTSIADTGFLIAFANRKDQYHSWAVEIASRVDRAPLTCEAVLAATAFRLENVSLVIAMVQNGLAEPRFALRDHLG